MMQNMTTSLTLTDSQTLLGVTRSAPLGLVERLYWKRTHELLQAERDGTPDAQARIEALNAAHAMIRELPAPELAALGAPAQATHRGLAFGVLAVTAAVAGAVAVGYSMAVGAVVFASGTVATLALGLRDAAPGHGPVVAAPEALEVLCLAPGATSDDIQIAYEILRDSTLSGGSDRDAAVLDRLERLQSAYHTALSSGGAAYRRS